MQTNRGQVPLSAAIAEDRRLNFKYTQAVLCR